MKFPIAKLIIISICYIIWHTKYKTNVDLIKVYILNHFTVNYRGHKKCCKPYDNNLFEDTCKVDYFIGEMN